MYRHAEDFSFESHCALVERHLRSPGWYSWFIVEVRGAAIGTISLYNYSADSAACECGRFVIEPQKRNAGCGRCALQLVMRYAALQGIRRLRCDVLASNCIALNLYRNIGFVPIGEDVEGARRFVTLVADLPVRS